MPPQWQDAFVTTFAIGLVLLSVVVITGYAGQLSLGQFALAGFGACVAGRLVDAAGWPFGPALLAGVAAAVPLGALFALPAVRARGINLAIVTLGLGTAHRADDLQQRRLRRRLRRHGRRQADAVRLGHQRHQHPGRYAIVCMGFFVARGADGRAACAAGARAAACWRCARTSGPPRRSASACPAPRSTPSRCRPASPRSAASCSAFRKDVDPLQLGVHELHVDPGGRLGVHRRHRLPARARSSAPRWRPGSLGAQVTNAIFAERRPLHPAHRRRHPDPAGAAEPGRHRQGVGQPDEVAGRQAARAAPAPCRAATPPTVELPPETRERVAPKTLEVRGLIVRYGGVMAVDDVSPHGGARARSSV